MWDVGSHLTWGGDLGVVRDDAQTMAAAGALEHLLHECICNIHRNGGSACSMAWTAALAVYAPGHTDREIAAEDLAVGNAQSMWPTQMARYDATFSRRRGDLRKRQAYALKPTAAGASERLACILSVCPLLEAGLRGADSASEAMELTAQLAAAHDIVTTVPHVLFASVEELLAGLPETRVAREANESPTAWASKMICKRREQKRLRDDAPSGAERGGEKRFDGSVAGPATSVTKLFLADLEEVKESAEFLRQEAALIAHYAKCGSVAGWDLVSLLERALTQE